jgi:hypothetical protein
MRWSNWVIHQAKYWACQTRSRQLDEYCASPSPSPRSDVGDGQVEALCARRRHDVDGVAREEQPAVLHGLGDEATHRRDAFLDDWAFLE